MLKIRDEQMQAFEKAGVRRFEEHLVEHLKIFSPGHAEVLGEEGLLRVIRFGMEKAAKYGFTNSGPIRLYVELMFLLGSDFDTDPQYPWAVEILAQANATNQMADADKLFDASLRFLDATAGPDREWARASLRLARQEPYDGLQIGAPDWVTDSLARLQRIYPERYAYVGTTALQKLLRRTREYAQVQGITSGSGAALVAALMFAAGHRFFADPHLPWIATTLSRSAESPNQQMDRLYSKLMIYLDRVLAKLPQG